MLGLGFFFGSGGHRFRGPSPVSPISSSLTAIRHHPNPSIPACASVRSGLRFFPPPLLPPFPRPLHAQHPPSFAVSMQPPAADRQWPAFTAAHSIAYSLAWHISRTFILRLNRTTVHGLHHLHRALADRPAGAALITACTHASVLDTYVVARVVSSNRRTRCYASDCSKNKLYLL